ncbi:MAG: hypothetical protein AUJ20_07425 [Comamonadaceae bacterium CG1_02_60_18]|nr:MAG: hypothetical protein AUJ20_07425 [Comamonadaceae bacterium CG1_02_60_18]PIQ52995.1 MAG: hypothetical protein COW02_07850 [Comamonadaceae bacterium CG12_big_fil_rev_8_21_14_0_65_59_15]
MKLVPVNVDAILIDQPLPCALRDQSGVLLASKGFRVDSRADLEAVIGKRDQIYIDYDQSDNFRRGYVNRINNLVLEDRALGQIAKVQVSPYDVKLEDVQLEAPSVPDWIELQSRCQTVLRGPQDPNFLSRLSHLENELSRHILALPDGTLFALMQLANAEMRYYSTTHAMLVCAMCSLAARDVLRWNEDDVSTLASAALTMNVSMTDLQDRLVTQKEPLTDQQKQLITSHAARSVDLLQRTGVTNEDWLEAVLHHNLKLPGPLATRSRGQRLARLIQRADMFAARLSPRLTRPPAAPSTAMQACYYDENRQIDEAGAALIKAVGIYSPGTYVRLATQEIAVVVKRGRNTTMPRVAVLINRQGMPTGEPIVRDTSLADFRIQASVPFRDIKIKHSMDRMLALTRPAGNDRPW